jgi:O-antigen ligase
VLPVVMKRFLNPAFWVVSSVVIAGLLVGVIAGTAPSLLVAAVVAPLFLTYFFWDFERAVIGLLILRSSLDVFSEGGIPAAYALGLNALTLIYVTVQLLTGRSVKTDWFWWCLAGWVAFQGLWLIFLPLGGLGFDASFLGTSIREWVRLFTLVMVYLLVMQLKDKIHPSKLISLLFLSLISPVVFGLIQVFAPSILPEGLILAGKGGEAAELAAQGLDVSRVNGTFGHPNTFAQYLVLFIALVWWKTSQVKQRWPWLLLLLLLTFVLVGTKALGALIMFSVFVLIQALTKIDPPKLFVSGVFLVIALALFGSTEFGQSRLLEISETPLLNPEIDISRAILIRGNSFNWRLAQWVEVLGAWKKHPFLGYGLDLSQFVPRDNNLAPHNDYIRAMVEEGLLGLAALLTFLTLQLTRLVSLLRRSQERAQYSLCGVLLAVGIAMCIVMLSDNLLSATPFLLYFWSAMAIAGWDWQKDENADNLSLMKTEKS